MDSSTLNILAIDTALVGCSVAIANKATGYISGLAEPMRRGQASRLIPLVQEGLAEQNTGFDDLDIIGVTTGPGSFTGVRVGLSTARALGLALDIPVVGVITLDVMARQILNDETAARAVEKGADLAVVLETKRRDFYYGLYSPTGEAKSPPQALTLDDIVSDLSGQNIVFGGDAVSRFKKEVAGLLDSNADQEAWTYVDGHSLSSPEALIASVKTKIGEDSGYKSPDPVYLRPADVSKPKRKPREIIYSDTT